MPCRFVEIVIAITQLERIFTLADLGGMPGAPPPKGAQFFRFCIHFHQKAPASEVHGPPNGSTPPTGNPGSATALHLGVTSNKVIRSNREHVFVQRVYFYRCVSISLQLIIKISVQYLLVVLRSSRVFVNALHCGVEYIYQPLKNKVKKLSVALDGSALFSFVFSSLLGSEIAEMAGG